MKKILVFITSLILMSCTTNDAKPIKISTEEQYRINLKQIKNSMEENNIEPLPKNYKVQIENKIRNNRKIKCKELLDSIEYARKQSLANISDIKGARRTYYLKELEYQIRAAKSQYNEVCGGNIKFDYSNLEDGYLKDYADKTDPTKPLFKRCVFGFDIISKSYIGPGPEICFQNGKIVNSE